MIIGKMDRKIRIFTNLTTHNDYGEEYIQSESAVDLWAAVDFKQGKVGIDADNPLAEIPVVFTTRYNQGFTANTLKYIFYNDVKYYIRSVQEIGRKQGLRIFTIAQSQ
tara:strand:- start:381 stop:704 length:324 start_codon:yes stop_codon:yes gene_type:complete